MCTSIHIEIIFSTFMYIIKFKCYRNMLSNVGSLNVKHKAGHLSYAEDPNGYKSLIAQTLSSNDFNSWSVSVSNNLLFFHFLI